MTVNDACSFVTLVICSLSEVQNEIMVGTCLANWPTYQKLWLKVSKILSHHLKYCHKNVTKLQFFVHVNFEVQFNFAH